jgi:glucose/arabinose dehydrogenase
MSLFLLFGVIILASIGLNITLPLKYQLTLAQGNIVNSTSNVPARVMEIPGSLFAHNSGEPTLKDSHLKVEKVVSGLSLPTTMAFVGNNDILVLEKAKGTVERILNGKLLSTPLLKANVESQVERGMLGIAVANNSSGHKNVFLYFTENTNPSTRAHTDGGTSVANRVYRYEYVDGKLINPKLVLDLPANPGPRHNAGSIIIGPDNNLYVPIGDVDGHSSQAQNVADGGPADGTGGILRITQDGKHVGNGILGAENPLNKYYAYGIRNTFGLSFDPLTNILWDTENGAGSDDEINVVNPGFNSGWVQVQGKAPPDFDYSQLVTFSGKGKYSDPEFTWHDTTGPTKILFFNSSKLGKNYENDIFVSDIHHGRIFHFELDANRTSLALHGPLIDRVADTDNETSGLIFGSNFGGISDMEVGPDGYLYVVSLGRGTIYKIIPIL